MELEMCYHLHPHTHTSVCASVQNQSNRLAAYTFFPKCNLFFLPGTIMIATIYQAPSLPSTLSHLILTTILRKRNYTPHFTAGKTETERSGVANLGAFSFRWWSGVWNSGTIWLLSSYTKPAFQKRLEILPASAFVMLQRLTQYRKMSSKTKKCF